MRPPRRMPLALSAAALVTVEWSALGISAGGSDVLVIAIGAVVAAAALVLLVGGAPDGGAVATAVVVLAIAALIAAVLVTVDEWSSRGAVAVLAGAAQALLGSRMRRDLTKRRSAYGTARPGDPLLLSVAGFVAAALLLGSTVVSADDDEGVGALDRGSPASSPTVTDDVTAAGGTATTEPPATEAVAASGPATTAGAAPQIAAPGTQPGEVPESLAIVKGGKIYLQGAVPTQAAADQIVALAGEVLGPANVINDYVVDPRATDPSLGNVRVDDPVLFETGTARIASDFEPLLNQALALMTIRPSVTMHVVGHTDDRGSEADNLDLSERRAQAVVTWWIERGVDPARLTSEGRGEAEPIASNETAEGRAANRRIQVFISNLLTAP